MSQSDSAMPVEEVPEEYETFYTPRSSNCGSTERRAHIGADACRYAKQGNMLERDRSYLEWHEMSLCPLCSREVRESDL